MKNIKTKHPTGNKATNTERNNNKLAVENSTFGWVEDDVSTISSEIQTNRTVLQSTRKSSNSTSTPTITNRTNSTSRVHPASSKPTAEPITRQNTKPNEVSWLNWLANKSKITTQKPTTTTRFRSNEGKDPFQELLLNKLSIPGKYLDILINHITAHKCRTPYQIDNISSKHFHHNQSTTNHTTQ